MISFFHSVEPLLENSFHAACSPFNNIDPSEIEQPDLSFQSHLIEKQGKYSNRSKYSCIGGDTETSPEIQPDEEVCRLSAVVRTMPQ